MDARDLIHPMTAGDLVVSACVLAIRERDMGEYGKLYGTETTIWECVALETEAGWPTEYEWATVEFRDRQTGGRIQLSLKADTPLLFTQNTR